MHPRIEEIVNQLNQNIPGKELAKSTLDFLKNIGVTQTESIISIHLAWQIPMSTVQDYVYKSSVFEPEDINEVAYQTFKYM